MTTTTTSSQPAFNPSSFGVAATAAVAPSFGFNPAVSVSVSIPTTQPPAFGSLSTATAQPTLPTFGSLPATTATTQLGFGSLVSKPTASVTFGATTSTAASTLPSFGLGTMTTINPMSTTSANPGTGFNFTAPNTGQLRFEFCFFQRNRNIFGEIEILFFSFGAAPTTTAATSSTDGGLFGK